MSAPFRLTFGVSPISELVRRAEPPRTSTRTARMLGIVSASLVSVPLGVLAPAASASGAPLPKPPTKKLPAALDIAPKYQAGTRCLAGDRSGPKAFAELLNRHYGARAYGINRLCALEHGEGRALDWMVDAKDRGGLALGNAITRWLSAPDAQGRAGAMARRFGINYIIWNRQIWRAYDPKRGWAAYTGSSPHTDHIHFSFTWDGAYQQTSWWTGKALTSVRHSGPTRSTPIATPGGTRSGYPHLRRGSTGKDVALAQGILGVTRDGSFGPMTEKALRSWQSRHKIPLTGQLDDATWLAFVARGLVPSRSAPARPAPPRPAPAPSTSGLSTAFTAHKKVVLQRGSRGAAVRALQAGLGGVAVDGSFGPATLAAVRNFQARSGLKATGVVDGATWSRVELKVHPLLPHWSSVVKRGSRGPAVVALQRALRISADGSFGPQTEAAVRGAQKRARIASTGVVATVTWRAIEKQL